MNEVTMENLLALFEDTLWFARNSIVVPAIDGENPRNGWLPKIADVRKALKANDYPSLQRYYRMLESWKGASAPMIQSHAIKYMSDVVDWYFNSKRMYQLSGKLTELLLNTKLPDFLAQDIKFVTHSFAIRLEIPIKLDQGDRLFDLILMNHDEETGGVTIHAYATKLGGYAPLTTRAKEVMLKYKHSFDARFDAKLERFVRTDLTEHGAFTGFTIGAGGDLSYQQVIERDIEDEVGRDACMQILQIALGLNFFIQMKRSIHNVQKEIILPRQKNERGNDIASGTDVFTLHSLYDMYAPSSVKSVDTGTGPGKRPHFREGCWRRPKGLGQDPNAEKTEWIFPLWVHYDRILAGEIPVGAKKFIRICPLPVKS